MCARHAYDYAVVRVVPSNERGEFINVGVVLCCRARRFLDARIELDRARLAALAPELDADEVERHLGTIPLICRGGAAAGPIGELTLPERWHWLVSPRSTVIQVSPAHAGLCADPAATLERLMDRLVRPARQPAGSTTSAPP